MTRAAPHARREGGFTSHEEVGIERDMVMSFEIGV
jgi:hypothetical protein